MLGGRSSPPKWSAEFCGCGEDPNTCKIPAEYLDDNTIFHLNPSGRFVIGGHPLDLAETFPCHHFI